MSLKRAFITLIGSGLTTQAIMFAGMLVLARLYSPSDFGEYGFYAGIASFAAVVAGLRFDYLAFTAGNQQNQLIHFYRAAILFSLITTIIAAIATTLLANKFENYTNFSTYAILFVLSSALYLIGTQHLLAQKEYTKYLKLRLYQAVSQIFTAIAFYKSEQINGLILAFGATQLIIGLYILKWSSSSPIISDYKTTLGIIKNHIGAATINTTITALQYSTPFAPIIIGSIYYNQADVGAYFLITQLIAAPCAIFRRSITNLLNAEFNDPQKLKAKIKQHKQLIKKATILSLTIAIPTFILAQTLKTEIIARSIGLQWIDHAALLAPLLVYYLFDSTLQPTTTLLPLWGKQASALTIETLRFASVFGILGFLASTNETSYLSMIEAYITIMIAWYLAGFLLLNLTLKEISHE